MNSFECPSCHQKMDAGFLALGKADLINHKQHVPIGTWIEGEPELGFWGWKAEGRKTNTVQAYCCSSCGLVALRAFPVEK